MRRGRRRGSLGNFVFQCPLPFRSVQNYCENFHRCVSLCAEICGSRKCFATNRQQFAAPRAPPTMLRERSGSSLSQHCRGGPGGRKAKTARRVASENFRNNFAHTERRFCQFSLHVVQNSKAFCTQGYICRLGGGA